jgi:hypothetical protein
MAQRELDQHASRCGRNKTDERPADGPGSDFTGPQARCLWRRYASSVDVFALESVSSGWRGHVRIGNEDRFKFDYYE